MRPSLLVFVRHGDAEHNLARRLSKKGDHSLFAGPFGKRSNFKARLTTLGRKQLQISGEWIRGNLPGPFDRYYCSEAVRAMESALSMGLPQALWSAEHILREQDAGILCTISEEKRRRIKSETPANLLDSPFFYRPSGSESVADMVENRIERFLDRLKGNEYERVACVCHGRLMDGLRFRLLHMTVQEWEEQEKGRNARFDIGNGQIHLYSRRHPIGGELTRYYGWFKSVRPTDLQHPSNTATWNDEGMVDGWAPIILRRFSNEELLKMVLKHEQLADTE